MNKDQSTEEKILEAARQIFTEKGFAGSRMQEIADRANINKAMLHYYFRTKEQLFVTIFKDARGKIAPQFEMMFASDMPIFDKIRQFTAQYIDLLMQNQLLPVFVLNELHQQPDKLVRKMFNDGRPDLTNFTKQLNAEIAAGNVRPIEPKELIINMVALCIFPFIGKPLFKARFQISNEDYQAFLVGRKKAVADFIIESIKLEKTSPTKKGMLKRKKNKVLNH